MTWLQNTVTYEKVASEDLDSDGNLNRPASISSWLRSRLFSHLNLIFFIFNILFLCITLWALHQLKSPNYLLKKINYYTPILDTYDFSFHSRKANASLFNIPYSIYKDNPSPEVDAAWEEISDTPVLAISKEAVLRMGKDPDYAVEVPLEFGYGPEKYFAVNDGQHLLHCLNEIRKFSFYSYYYSAKYPSEADLPPLHAAHRSHCIGVLLDALTCHPSLNMVTWEWIEDQNEPYPDFNIHSQCVDYSAFTRWMEREQISREVIKGYTVKWDGGRGRNGGKGGKTRERIQEFTKTISMEEHMGHGEPGYSSHGLN